MDKEALLGDPQVHNNDNLMIEIITKQQKFIKPVTLRIPIASITKKEVIQYPGDIKLISKISGKTVKRSYTLIQFLFRGIPLSTP